MTLLKMQKTKCSRSAQSEGEGSAHLSYDGFAFKLLEFPEQDESRYDVGRDDVEVSEEIAQESSNIGK